MAIKRQLHEDDYAIEKEWLDPEIKAFIKRHKKYVIGVPLGILTLLLGTWLFLTYQSHARESRLSTNYDQLVKSYEDMQDTIDFNYVEGSNRFPKDAVSPELIDQQMGELEQLKKATIQQMDVANPSTYSERLELSYKHMDEELKEIKAKLVVKKALNDLFAKPAIVDGIIHDKPTLKRDLSVEAINVVNNLIHEPTDGFWVAVGDLHSYAKSQQALIASVNSFIESLDVSNMSYDSVMQNVDRVNQISDPIMQKEKYLAMEPIVVSMLDQYVQKMYASGTGTVNLATTSQEVDRALALIGVLKNFIVQYQYLEKLQPVTLALRDQEAQMNVEKAYQQAVAAEEARNGVKPGDSYKLDWRNVQGSQGSNDPYQTPVEGQEQLQTTQEEVLDWH